MIWSTASATQVRETIGANSSLLQAIKGHLIKYVFLEQSLMSVGRNSGMGLCENKIIDF